MESQILYKSLTKPRCDLDKNMNKTIENIQGNDSVTVNTEILAVENSVSAQDIMETQNYTHTTVQSTESVAAEIKIPHKSKLLEQLQSPLEISTEKRDYIKTQLLHQGEGHDSYHELSKTTDESMSRDGSNPGHSNIDTSDNKLTNCTSPPDQNLNFVVSTNTIKSETASLASPTPSVSSSRSMSTSPLPSPGTSIASPNEVSSSKSVPDSFKKRKRRRRGSAWTDAETEYLMEVWARQADIIKQKGGDESVTCAPVYRFISRSMGDQGWDKTWEQCKTRIHTLKRAYKITKDEITDGCQTITYCRHFDKLEIICGDNTQVSPGMLSITLEHKRKQREYEGKTKTKQPVRRKLTVGENPNLAKKANDGNNLLNVVGFSQLQGQNSVSPQSVVSVQSIPTTNAIWYPPLPTQQQQFQLQQQQPQFQLQQPQPQFQLQQQPPATTLNQSPQTFIQTVQQPSQSSVLPAPPLFPYNETTTSGNDSAQQPSYSSTVEVNNNKINAKSEKSDTKIKEENPVKQYEKPGTQWNVLSSPQSSTKTVTAPPTSTGSDLERMRLDLEIRKLEVERNKIEMEERQRREDRDHQYRMMQLLLFGLGQQNISQVSDDTHAHDTVLSRALENGLVPGGPQKANEKGLSFSEL